MQKQVIFLRHSNLSRQLAGDFVYPKVMFMPCLDGIIGMRIFFNATVFTLALLGLSAIGCDGGSTEPQAPEMGSVQKYLDEHPEEREESGTVSEADEFGAAQAGT